ncbi:MAG: hypothetical protein KKA67_04340 [Spirochaetes bacterium]|nr:hypothetical protein [Spirochaetota bacterium]MBU1082356.1 hypothetical protein [Spirochaetota bacterium]
MSIFVSVEDLEGEPLSDIFEIERVYRKFPKEAGVCLRFVGEAVDASFNALQTPSLLAELEAVSGAALDAAERAELERVLKVCAKHAGKKNSYVKFYGEAKSSE